MYLSTHFVVILIYLILIQLFGFFIKYVEYWDSFLCFNCTEHELLNTQFDYIIVGCGSAGAVVARRLAEDQNVKILVLEAGKQGSTLLDIPSVGLLLQNTPFDWQYTSVPQASSCFALNNNASHWPMGKIVGGTSMLNNMVYVRGHPDDFKQWFDNQNNYNFTTDILPYFQKLENEMVDDESGGSVYLSDLAFTSSLPNYILNAGKSLNFEVSDVTNCELGFGMPKVNIKHGERWTSSHRLVKSNKPNIFLRTGRTVEKVLFHNNFEVYGVQYSYLGQSYNIKASRGVILSAGVVGTTKILLLSGIGPKTHLAALNITTKVDAPVGENLQDHITTGLDLILLNQTLGIGIEQMLSPYSIFQYFWNGTGPWTTGGCEVLAFINTKDTHCDSNMRPDLQFMVMPLGINEDNGVHLRHLMGINDYTWNNYFSYLNQTKAMTILPILSHPKSRGIIRLKDANFKSSPIIDPGYLKEYEDVEVLIKGIQLIKELINTEHMQKLGARLNTNVFPGCEKFEFDSKEYWECYVRHLTITSYHPVGTCKMGQEDDPTSVVNYNFQVKGTNKLYVVDASVMPTITSGNVNAAVLMLAEMASDVIKFNDFLRRETSSITEIFIPKNIC